MTYQPNGIKIAIGFDFANLTEGARLHERRPDFKECMTDEFNDKLGAANVVFWENYPAAGSGDYPAFPTLDSEGHVDNATLHNWLRTNLELAPSDIDCDLFQIECCTHTKQGTWGKSRVLDLQLNGVAWTAEEAVEAYDDKVTDLPAQAKQELEQIPIWIFVSWWIEEVEEQSPPSAARGAGSRTPKPREAEGEQG